MEDYEIDERQNPVVIRVRAEYLATALQRLASFQQILDQYPYDKVNVLGPVAFDMAEAGKKAIEAIEALPANHPLKKETDLAKMRKGIEVIQSGRVNITANGPPAPTKPSVLEIMIE